MKTNLFKLLGILVFVLVGFSNIALAQQKQAKKNLYFVYIDHEPTSNTNVLCDKIKELRTDAMDTGDGVIVYLSNGFYPMVSFTNVNDPDDLYSGDSRFNDIIGGLQELNSHEVNPVVDLKTICSILELAQLNDVNMKLGYESVVMDFYIGTKFWTLHNNEKLLARLYSAFEIPTLQKGDLEFSIYKEKGDVLSYEEGMPFGIKNIDGVNKLTISDY